jgi:TPR repeat protein
MALKLVAGLLLCFVATALPVLGATLDEIRAAAVQGDPVAQTELGYRYASGRGGVPHDNQQALLWYRKAAAQGYAVAQTNLGYAYASGQGVRINLEQAADWFRKAAEQGYDSAQANLGALYLLGQGVPTREF